MNLDTLPPRLVTAEVLQIARFGEAELRRRIRQGVFPKPVDRGGKGFIFRKNDVLEALGIHDTAADVNPFEAALQNEIEPSKKRCRPPA